MKDKGGGFGKKLRNKSQTALLILSVIAAIIVAGIASFSLFENSERQTLFIGKTLSQTLSFHILSREVYMIADSINRFEAEEWFSTVVVTDADFNVIHSRMAQGLPANFYLKKINPKDYHYQFEIQTEGITVGYLLFNKNNSRVILMVILVAFITCSFFYIVYVIINKFIVSRFFNRMTSDINKVEAYISNALRDLRDSQTSDSRQKYLEYQRKLETNENDFGSLAKLKNSAQQTLALLIEFSDSVAERNRLQVLLTESEENLNKARLNALVNEAVARMTHTLAHDVRKPFTILKGIINVLGDVNNQDEVRNDLPAMLDEVQRSLTSVDGLIKDVLEIGKNNEITTEATNPVTLLEIFLIDLSHLYPNADITMTFFLKALNYVNVDTTRVLRVFLNIACNGIEAMQHHGTLWITTDLIEKGSQKFVEFKIGNNGPAIPEVELPFLFDAFYTKDKKGGTGLGLAIAKKIVEAHQGDIRCESSTDTETIFSFSFPAIENMLAEKVELPSKLKDYNKSYGRVKSASNIKDEESRIERTLVAKLQHISKKIKIILVDDEAIYRESLVTLLSVNSDIYSCLEIIHADNYISAMEILNSPNPPDIAVLDIDLGKNSPDGIKIAQALHYRGYKGKICIHSNRFLSSTQVSEINVNKITRKPMDRKDFLELISSCAPEIKSTPCDMSLLAESEKVISIAVIEDSEALLYLIKKQIKRYAKISHYFYPEEFLKEFPRSNFDMVITDQNFEPLSAQKGLEMARKLREEYHYTKPIVLASLEKFQKGANSKSIDLVVDKNHFGWDDIYSLLPPDKIKQTQEKLEWLDKQTNSEETCLCVSEEPPSSLVSDIFAFAKNRIPHAHLSEKQIKLLPRLIHDLRGETFKFITYLENLSSLHKQNDYANYHKQAIKLECKLAELKPFCSDMAFKDFKEKLDILLTNPSKIEDQVVKETIYILINDIDTNPYHKFTRAEQQEPLTNISNIPTPESILPKKGITIMINDVAFKTRFEEILLENHPDLSLCHDGNLTSAIIAITDNDEFHVVASNEKIPTYYADTTDSPDEFAIKVVRFIKQYKKDRSF